ncbi:MAG: alpha/beta hydrolase [Verrucomicrobiae bacterium]|nr:alpha/beta hydrolase [Verrucomicrobiae bacterium]
MKTTHLKAFLFGKFSWKRILLSLAEIYLGLLVFAWFFADLLIHHPPTQKYGALAGEVTFTAKDGTKLCGAWIPQKKASLTILFSHGNAEHMGNDMPFLRELWSAGFNVFAYDYRGYGHSEGKPTEKGLYQDVDAAYKHLTQNLRIPPENILVMGRSLGSGPSTWLAAHEPVGGLVVESGFTSAFRVPIPFPLFPFDQFPNLKRLDQIRCPLLVIHGMQDEVIPNSHGKKLFSSYQGPKKAWWVETAGHNDIFSTNPDEYLRQLREFAKEIPLHKTATDNRQNAITLYHGRTIENHSVWHR